jgi:adenosylhomocysteine nucleosidase
MQKLLILAALPQEIDSSLGKFDKYLYYTGVGKINAAITTTTLIIENKPDLVINIGTAGSYEKHLSGLVECGVYLDRDNTFNTEKIAIDKDKALISTGDSFVTTGGGVGLVDMEAYAIAKACNRFNVPFLCFKYVSDYVGENSVISWQEKISDGKKYYMKTLSAIFGERSKP